MLNSPSLTAQDIGRTTRGGDAGDHADDHATNGPHLHCGIEKDGAFATFVTVSGSAELFGTIRPVRVSGTIDGHSFIAILMPSGDGPHCLPTKAGLSTLIGKDQAGDEVTFPPQAAAHWTAHAAGRPLRGRS